jgi:hypothetical protein
MQLDLCERLRRGNWTLADWRRSYAPGGDVFYIPALKAANQGVWREGALVSVAGFVITTQFTDGPTPSQLGTLWPDRLVETLADRLVRDELGRPLIRYCEGYAVLQLVPEDPTSGWPCFNVANLDSHAEYLHAWVEHSRSEQLLTSAAVRLAESRTRLRGRFPNADSADGFGADAIR